MQNKKIIEAMKISAIMATPVKQYNIPRSGRQKLEPPLAK